MASPNPILAIQTTPLGGLLAYQSMGRESGCYYENQSEVDEELFRRRNEGQRWLDEAIAPPHPDASAIKARKFFINYKRFLIGLPRPLTGADATMLEWVQECLDIALGLRSRL